MKHCDTLLGKRSGANSTQKKLLYVSPQKGAQQKGPELSSLASMAMAKTNFKS